MVSALVVLMSTVVLEKVLGRRGITILVNGKVWSDELSTFVSAPEAFLAGLGKARKTVAEREVFDLLLVDAAGREAVKAAKQRDREMRVRTGGIKRHGNGMGFNKDRLLGMMVDGQEKLACIRRLIDIVNGAISRKWACKQTSEILVKKNGLNRYAGFVFKAWNTKPEDRTRAMVNTLKRDDNQELIEMFEARKRWWDLHNKVKDAVHAFAEEYGLYPAYWQLVRSCKVSGKGEDLTTQAFGKTMVETRTQSSFNTILVNGKAVEVEYIDLVINTFQHVGRYEEDEDSGLTGQWQTDTIGTMADAHVAENASLQAAYKKCERHIKWKRLRSKTSKAQDIAWAKARRLERQRDAWRLAAKQDERAEKTAAEKAAREARKAKRAAKKLAAVTTFSEDNWVFPSEEAELQYMELMLNR